MNEWHSSCLNKTYETRSEVNGPLHHPHWLIKLDEIHRLCQAELLMVPHVRGLLLCPALRGEAGRTVPIRPANVDEGTRRTWSSSWQPSSPAWCLALPLPPPSLAAASSWANRRTWTNFANQSIPDHEQNRTQPIDTTQHNSCQDAWQRMDWTLEEGCLTTLGCLLLLLLLLVHFCVLLLVHASSQRRRRGWWCTSSGAGCNGCSSGALLASL